MIRGETRGMYILVHEHVNPMNRLINRLKVTAQGAISSVGRASRLHREGRQFEPVIAHHSPKDKQNSLPTKSIAAFT
jgi:hypothetical protein